MSLRSCRFFFCFHCANVSFALSWEWFWGAYFFLVWLFSFGLFRLVFGLCCVHLLALVPWFLPFTLAWGFCMLLITAWLSSSCAWSFRTLLPLLRMFLNSEYLFWLTLFLAVDFTCPRLFCWTFWLAWVLFSLLIVFRGTFLNGTFCWSLQFFPHDYFLILPFLALVFGLFAASPFWLHYPLALVFSAFPRLSVCSVLLQVPRLWALRFCMSFSVAHFPACLHSFVFTVWLRLFSTTMLVFWSLCSVILVGFGLSPHP